MGACTDTVYGQVHVATHCEMLFPHQTSQQQWILILACFAEWSFAVVSAGALLSFRTEIQTVCFNDLKIVDQISQSAVYDFF